MSEAGTRHQKRRRVGYSVVGVKHVALLGRCRRAAVVISLLIHVGVAYRQLGSVIKSPPLHSAASNAHKQALVNWPGSTVSPGPLWTYLSYVLVTA